MHRCIMCVLSILILFSWLNVRNNNKPLKRIADCMKHFIISHFNHRSLNHKNDVKMILTPNNNDNSNDDNNKKLQNKINK